MNLRILHRAIHEIAGVHACTKGDLRNYFDYEDVVSAEISTLQNGLKAALRKSDAYLALDLKTKCGSGTEKDAAKEKQIFRKMLKELETGTDAELTEPMLELLSFYESIRNRDNETKFFSW